MTSGNKNTGLDAVARGYYPQSLLITTHISGLLIIALCLHLLPLVGLGLTKIKEMDARIKVNQYVGLHVNFLKKLKFLSENDVLLQTVIKLEC